jgi:hypothetical protein
MQLMTCLIRQGSPSKFFFPDPKENSPEGAFVRGEAL